MKRVLTTAAGVTLFAMAVAVALSFGKPNQPPPTTARTAQMFLALAALWPSALTAYLAGRGQYRGATIAALAAGALYLALAAVALVAGR